MYASVTVPPHPISIRHTSLRSIFGVDLRETKLDGLWRHDIDSLRGQVSEQTNLQQAAKLD